MSGHGAAPARGGHTSSARRSQAPPSTVAVDARLVPPAVLAWAAAGVAVAQDVRMVLAGGGLAALVTVVAVGRHVRHRRAQPSPPSPPSPKQRPRRRPGRRRHRGPPVRSTAVVILTACALSAVLVSTAAQQHVRYAAPLAELAARGASVVLTGRVASEPRAVSDQRAWEDAPRRRLTLRVEELSGQGRAAEAAAEVVLVGPPEWHDAPLGARVRVRATLVSTAPGDRAVALAVAAQAPEVLDPPHGHLAVVNELRDGLRAVTTGLAPDARGLVPGIAVGDDRAVPLDLEQAMRATALTHLTAVSGAHVAIVLGTVLAALVWAPRRWRLTLAALALVGFVTLVRPEASVLRSAVMGGVVLAALAAGRPARALPALCTAVVALLVVDPWLARSFGFALSVLATAGLVLLAAPWRRWLAQLVPCWLATAVAVPAAAQAACAPVVVLLEPSVAGYAVPANLLAAPVVPPVTVLGVAATLLAPVWPSGATALAVAASVGTGWIATVARVLAGLPGAQLPWVSGPAGLLLMVVVTVAAVVLLGRAGPRLARSRGAVLAVGAAVTVLLVVTWLNRASWVPGPRPPPDWVAVQCDVGQGGAFLVRSGERSAVLVDVGPADGDVVTCLRAAQVERLDLLVLTHAHADHIGALPAVLRTVEVARVLLGPGPEPAAAVSAVLRQLGDVPVARPVSDGADAHGHAGTVEWRVLWPPAATVTSMAGDDGINDLSLVLDMRTSHLRTVALGDLELTGQAGLLRRLRSAGFPGPVDVVVMAHHGSGRQDPALAAHLRTRLAVVSVGVDNDYGHPHPDALSLYRQQGALVLRTDTCGPIAVVPAGVDLGVHSACPP
ncbi:DUF4131 domain-containing protein [Georgenia yuyongxinii]|uniref:DUF4131 domain-containing protein n=1 Tax=Georgenia yuyongxinii TaxID=2589797 RepID=A0A5B8C2H5_9MICO|nr:DUF4131 domain-containing protein [Georgenia yuyongxinii]